MKKNQRSSKLSKLTKLEKKKSSIEQKIYKLRRDLLDDAIKNKLEEVKNSDSRYSVVRPTTIEPKYDVIRKFIAKSDIVKKAKKKKIDLSGVIIERQETITTTDLDTDILEQLIAEGLLTTKKYRSFFNISQGNPYLRRDPKYKS